MGSSVRSRLEAAGNTVSTWLTKFIGILGTVLVVLNIIQITLRTTMRYSFPWVPEASVFLGAWIVLLGASVIFIRGQEVQVTALVSVLPLGAQKVVDFLVALVSASFGVMLFFSNLKYRDLVNMTKPTYLPVEYSILTYPLYVLAISIVFWSVMSVLTVSERRTNHGVAAPDDLTDHIDIH